MSAFLYNLFSSNLIFGGTMKTGLKAKILLIVMILLLTLISTACLHDKKNEKKKILSNSVNKDDKKDTSIGEKKIITEDDLKKKEDTDNKGSSVKEKDGKQFGYISNVHTDNDRSFLDIDYAQMLTGEEANKAALKAGDEVNNDYYIVNQNKKIRTFEINQSAVITLQTWRLSTTGQIKDTSLTLDKFVNIFYSSDDDSKRLAANPYWITIKDGFVAKIEEQYIP